MPPVKEFGRKRDHMSGKGWGRYDDGQWVPLAVPDYRDGNPTKKFTEKLRQSFYDARRLVEFRGEQAGKIKEKIKKKSALELDWNDEKL